MLPDARCPDCSAGYGTPQGIDGAVPSVRLPGIAGWRADIVCAQGARARRRYRDHGCRANASLPAPIFAKAVGKGGCPRPHSSRLDGSPIQPVHDRVTATWVEGNSPSQTERRLEEPGLRSACNAVSDQGNGTRRRVVVPPRVVRYATPRFSITDWEMAAYWAASRRQPVSAMCRGLTHCRSQLPSTSHSKRPV
jgi:hypothetical protein